MTKRPLIVPLAVYWLDSAPMDWVVRIPDGTLWRLTIASLNQPFTTITPYEGDTDCLVHANYDVARMVFNTFCSVWLPL